MNKAERVILIVLLVLTGVLLQLYGLVLSIEGEFSLGAGIFLLGFVLYFLGRHFGDWPKFLVKLLTHSGLFLLSVALVVLVVSSSAKHIANSIQPTIDYVAAYAIEDVVDQLKEDLPNERLTLMLAENVEIRTMYSGNLSLEDANVLAEIFGLSDKSTEDKLFFSQFIIGLVYSELQRTDGFENVILPSSTLREQYSLLTGSITDIDRTTLTQLCDLNSGDISVILSNLRTLDPQTFSSISVELITSICSNDPNAFLSLALYDDQITKTIETKNIETEDAILIWENLGLYPGVSIDTKKAFLEIGLSTLAPEIASYDIGLDAIPVTTVGSLLPNDIKNLFKYDLFSPSLYVRQQSISLLRDDCKGGVTSIQQLCTGILYTEFDYLMSNLDTIESEEMIVSEEIIEITTEFNSVEKIEENLSAGSYVHNWVLVLSVLLMVFGVVISQVISIRKGENHAFIRAMFEVGKDIFVGFLPYFAISLVMLLLFVYGIEPVVQLMSSYLPEDSSSLSNVILSLPIINSFSTLFTTMFFVHLWWQVNFLVFLIIAYILKREYLENK